MKDDLVKVMAILSSINPNMTIKASAAMDNSQLKTSNLDRISDFNNLPDKQPVFDLQNCFYYLYRKPNIFQIHR